MVESVCEVLTGRKACLFVQGDGIYYIARMRQHVILAVSIRKDQRYGLQSVGDEYIGVSRS